jgi:hypothetical protein
MGYVEDLKRTFSIMEISPIFSSRTLSFSVMLAFFTRYKSCLLPYKPYTRFPYKEQFFNKTNNTKEIKQFWGFANYHQGFVVDYACIEAPLYQVTGKKPFVWETEQAEAFEGLKEALVSPTGSGGRVCVGH